MTDPKEYAASIERYNVAQKQRSVNMTDHPVYPIEAVRKARNDALEEAAKVATSFLVGDPANGVPLRNPMAHEIADAIRALKQKEPA